METKFYKPFYFLFINLLLESLESSLVYDLYIWIYVYHLYMTQKEPHSGVCRENFLSLNVAAEKNHG